MGTVLVVLLLMMLVEAEGGLTNIDDVEEEEEEEEDEEEDVFLGGRGGLEERPSEEGCSGSILDSRTLGERERRCLWGAGDRERERGGEEPPFTGSKTAACFFFLPFASSRLAPESPVSASAITRGSSISVKSKLPCFLLAVKR